MVTQNDLHVIPGPDAAEWAAISYRQLDHWARQGWVVPSVRSGSGRGGRRLYSVDDVLRLAALRHFAKSGWQVKVLGAQLAELDVEGVRWLMAGTESGLSAIGTGEEIHDWLDGEERFTIFDLDPLRVRLHQDESVDFPDETAVLRKLA